MSCLNRLLAITQKRSQCIFDTPLFEFKANTGATRATTEAPKEQPGTKRTNEMKMLYGKGAAMIHGMETALQLTYDRNLDLRQPKLWPHLPLNIKFD